jgi:hypothetical protein
MKAPFESRFNTTLKKLVAVFIPLYHCGRRLIEMSQKKGSK